MKLYTEEEVMKLMLSMKTYIESHNLIFKVELDQLTHIELPSDEEIEQMAEEIYPISADYKKRIQPIYDDFNTCWKEGANYVINKIQGNNNKQDNFEVYTSQMVDKDVSFTHWSEGLTMYITKDGVKMKLNSEDIQQIVKALPRTLGGTYQ